LHLPEFPPDDPVRRAELSFCVTSRFQTRCLWIELLSVRAVHLRVSARHRATREINHVWEINAGVFVVPLLPVVLPRSMVKTYSGVAKRLCIRTHVGSWGFLFVCLFWDGVRLCCPLWSPVPEPSDLG
jgi:hypothetical protein